MQLWYVNVHIDLAMPQWLHNVHAVLACTSIARGMHRFHIHASVHDYDMLTVDDIISDRLLQQQTNRCVACALHVVIVTGQPDS